MGTPRKQFKRQLAEVLDGSAQLTNTNECLSTNTRHYSIPRCIVQIAKIGRVRQTRFGRRPVRRLFPARRTLGIEKLFQRLEVGALQCVASAGAAQPFLEIFWPQDRHHRLDDL